MLCPRHARAPFRAALVPCALLAVRVSVHAATTTNYWINSSSTGNYTNSSNWAPAAVPATTNNFVWVTNGGAVNFNANYTIGQLYMAPLNNSTGYFNMSGGALTISTNNLWLGGSASNAGTNSYGAFTMTGGTLNVVKNSVKD